MRRAWAYPVFRLEADGYSVPRGALGIVDEELKSGRLAVRWLPPHTGTSAPVLREHVVEAGEFLLPEHLWPPTETET